MQKKTFKHFYYDGLGFSIHLINVPMIKTRGEWTPDINYNQLQKSVLLALVTKSTSLTGNEICFIRKYFCRTLQSFGQEFGVTHVAVMDWEKEGNKAVKMNPATEKCIRLFILDELKVADRKFRKSYHDVKINQLAEHQKSKKKIALVPLVFDLQDSFLACG